ncbi:MAG TPA: DDE-type integrase/transposase/recombinase, partial [Gemmatimonadales bacterium]|nr:DDE-type integrase/transposase/recombinase [Gemmatimonadales bacterium]
MPQSRTPWPLATRVSLVVAFSELRRRHPGLSARRFCQATEVPYPTFARWWARYRRHGPAGLQPCSRRPHRSPTALPGHVLDVIRAAHRETGLGVRRLHAVLTRAGRIACSTSSVYRVLRRAGALARRPRRPKPRWTRYAKATPGERAQLDLKYLPGGRYQLTLIDDCSRLLAAAVLPARTQAAVCAALPRLLAAFPFPVRTVQTDHGAEFGRQVTAWLRARGIRHTQIRPRTPRLNGKVERVHRTLDEELWAWIAGTPPETWAAQLRAYVRFYNEVRLHSA